MESSSLFLDINDLMSVLYFAIQNGCATTFYKPMNKNSRTTNTHTLPLVSQRTNFPFSVQNNREKKTQWMWRRYCTKNRLASHLIYSNSQPNEWCVTCFFVHKLNSRVFFFNLYIKRFW